MAAEFHGYPPVSIWNHTSFDTEGVVMYRAPRLCGHDEFVAAANGFWRAEGRGICLVTEITAKVKTPAGVREATPYTSTGTSYAEFDIIETAAGEFAVVRPATGAEDFPPEDYVEPTTLQK